MSGSNDLKRTAWLYVSGVFLGFNALILSSNFSISSAYWSAIGPPSGSASYSISLYNWAKRASKSAISFLFSQTPGAL